MKTNKYNGVSSCYYYFKPCFHTKQATRARSLSLSRSRSTYPSYRIPFYDAMKLSFNAVNATRFSPHFLSHNLVDSSRRGKEEKKRKRKKQFDTGIQPRVKIIKLLWSFALLRKKGNEKEREKDDFHFLFLFSLHVNERKYSHRISCVCVCNKEYAFDVSLLNLSRICSWDFEAEVVLYFAERWKNFSRPAFSSCK